MGETTRTLARRAGRFRAQRLRDGFVDYAAFRQTEHYRRYYTGQGVTDRIWVICPVDAHTESVFVLDRHRRAELTPRQPFTGRDTALAAAVLQGQRALHRRLILSNGTLRGVKTLSPLKRCILLRLLTGQGDKEIADEVALRPLSLRKYITELYAEYGVKTRAGLMALWLGEAHAQNLLSNPSFELASTNTNPVPNWSVGGNGAVTSSDEGGASDGVQEAIFSGGVATTGNTLAQTVGTTFGAVYHLSLDASVFGDTGGGNYTLQIDVTDAQSGSTLASSNVSPFVSGFGSNQYTTYTLDFTATSAATTLTLTDLGGDASSADMIVDNTMLAAAVVPEPSTWALLGLGGVFLLNAAPVLSTARSRISERHLSPSAAGCLTWRGGFVLREGRSQ